MPRLRRASVLKSNQDGWVRVVTPYNANFVDALKADISPSHRKWDPTNKCWLVYDAYLEEVLVILKDHYDEVHTDLDAKPRYGDTPYKVMHLLPTAPDVLVKSAYRLLSMSVHPDRGGSEDMQVKLNLAYEDIAKERGL